MRILIFMGLLLLFASSADAQLGQNEAACQQRWGVPVATNEVTGKSQCISYVGPDMLFVKLNYVDGIVCRATYEKPNLTPSEVRELLNANAEGKQWDTLIIPGQPPEAANGRQWMRSDETCMASQTSNGLTIIAATWNRLCREEPSVAASNQTPAIVNTNSNQFLLGEGVNVVIPNQQSEAKEKSRKILPAHLPERGVSRREAIEVLGSPLGTMMRGSKEALVYSWGSVWLTNNRVDFIE